MVNGGTIWPEIEKARRAINPHLQYRSGQALLEVVSRLDGTSASPIVDDKGKHSKTFKRPLGNFVLGTEIRR